MPDSVPEMPVIRVAMMPKDTNVHGTIFGGVILSWIDQAGAIAVRHIAIPRVVTVCMKEVVFREPVYVGDVVSCYATVEHVGNTSVAVRIRVDAERLHPNGKIVHVTDAEVVYVAVDEHGQKMPIRKSGAPTN